MEVEVKKTYTTLGRLVYIFQNKIFLILFSFLFITLSGVIFSLRISTSNNRTISLSPLGFGIKTEAKDLLYDKVMNSKTLDNFPPNNFFPQTAIPKFSNGKLDLTAKAYAVMDLDSRELLYAKNLTQRLPVASIAKVLTALIVLENIPLDLEMKVSHRASQIGEASMGLSEGEKLSVKELLYGAVLPSGNDAAETLAEGVGKYKKGVSLDDVDGGGAREWFLNAMNQKVQSLGMMDTYFFNPTGLDEDSIEKTSFSTALDLLALGNYAILSPEFASIASTHDFNIPYKDGFHKAFYLENILQLDGAFKGIKGIKPGNSNFAGETLLSYVERDGKRLIAVVLGSGGTKDDVMKIYKEIFGLDSKRQSGRLVKNPPSPKATADK